MFLFIKLLLPIEGVVEGWQTKGQPYA